VKFVSKQFVFFLLTGGVAAAINFVSRVFYSHWFNFSLSIVIAYITGMIAAFVLARIFVFTESKHSLQRSALFFVLVNVVSICQTWVVSIALAFYFLPMVGWKFFVPEISHAVGIIVPVFSSYIGHKHWTFR
jgi:putative flippase GtrA